MTTNEPQFEYGEEIEVTNDYNELWCERIYVCTIPGKAESRFVCVSGNDEFKFKKGEEFETLVWKYARKIQKPVEEKTDKKPSDRIREIYMDNMKNKKTYNFTMDTICDYLDELHAAGNL